jgi:redox-sensitive bicupin YhaK (pirin superfamily)
VTHEDSLGTKSVMRAGDVKRMSAGTGIRHSEFNLGEVPAHFYQIWIYPDTSGLPPSYDQKSFTGTVWTNRLVPVASGQGLPDVVTFHTDATLYLGSLEAHRSVTHDTNGTRRVFVYLTEGELVVDGARLSTKDQGRIDAEATLTLTAHKDTRFVLIDVPSCRGWGYDQATLRGTRGESL